MSKNTSNRRPPPAPPAGTRGRTPPSSTKPAAPAAKKTTKTAPEFDGAPNFQGAVRALKAKGFEEGPRTKSHLYTLRRQTPHSRAYLSIRWDYNNDFTTVMAEFWGRTRTRLPGVGAEAHLIEVTPAQHSITRFAGASAGPKVSAHFVEIARLMLRAAAVFDAMEAF